MYSEIFDNYAKIALEQGLISQGDDKSSNTSSTELSTIEVLYGVKPNDDEKHIMEQAHPEPVVVSPAHDKMNGLVENEIERQNISAYIAQKPNTGNFDNFRYVKAQEDLLNEIIKVSFLLDQRNDTMLMSLSDICGEQLTKTAYVMIPAAIMAVLGGLGYAVYKGNHPSSQGFTQDLTSAIEEIAGTSTYDGAFQDYPELEKTLGGFVSNLRSLQSKFAELELSRQEIKKNLLSLAGATSPEEKKKILMENVVHLVKGETYKKIVDQTNELEKLLEAVSKSLPLAISELKEAESRYETSEPGVWTAVKEIWRWTVNQSDVEDAWEALEVLSSSLPLAVKDISDTKNGLEQLKSSVVGMEISAPSSTDKDLKTELQELMKDDTKAPTDKSPAPAKVLTPEMRNLPGII